MDDLALAQLMIEYRQTLNKAEILAQVIQSEVLVRAGTVKLPGVLKAAYFQASADVDYESAARAAGCTTTDIAAHTTQNPSIKWKEVAAGVRANLAPYTIVKPARVKLTELVKPDTALDKSEPLPFVLEMEDATCI